MVQEARDFIPTGNCVEQDRALFANPAAADLAIRSCLECHQLVSCTEQRLVISAILIERGEERPVVGAAVEAPPDNLNLSRVVQLFGEVTLGFNRRPLPKDGQRALRSTQQAFRARQVSPENLYQIRRSAFDIEGWVQGQLDARDPEIMRPLDAATRASIAREVGGHILHHSAKRQPNGRPVPAPKRFTDLDPEAYYHFVCAFAAEAAAHAALGLPDPARRTSYHGLAFHEAYLEEGARRGVSRGYLLDALKDCPTDPLQLALSRQDENKTRASDYYRRARAAEKIAHVGQPLEELFANEEPATLARIHQLHEYGVVDVRMVDGQPRVKLGNDFSYFKETEQAGVLHALGLTKFTGAAVDLLALRAELGVYDLDDFVFTVLLPHFNPGHFEEEQTADIHVRPDLLLAAIRKEAWAKRLDRNRAQKIDTADVLQALEILPRSQRRRNFWSENYKHLLRFYGAADYLAEQRDDQLDFATFLRLFMQYDQDVQALLRAGANKPEAARIAMLYSPATYSRTRTYAMRNPNVTKSLVDDAFRRRITAPLQVIRAFEQRHVGPHIGRKITTRRRQIVNDPSAGKRETTSPHRSFLSIKNNDPVPQPFRPFSDSERLIWLAGNDVFKLEACGAELSVHDGYVITGLEGQSVELDTKDKFAFILLALGAPVEHIHAHCMSRYRFSQLLSRTGCHSHFQKGWRVYSTAVLLACRELLTPTKKPTRELFNQDFSWLKKSLRKDISRQALAKLRMVAAEQTPAYILEDIPEGPGINLQILVAYAHGRIAPRELLAGLGQR